MTLLGVLGGKVLQDSFFLVVLVGADLKSKKCTHGQSFMMLIFFNSNLTLAKVHMHKSVCTYP
jgi:hypothetical protein